VETNIGEWAKEIRGLLASIVINFRELARQMRQVIGSILLVKLRRDWWRSMAVQASVMQEVGSQIPAMVYDSSLMPAREMVGIKFLTYVRGRKIIVGKIDLAHCDDRLGLVIHYFGVPRVV